MNEFELIAKYFKPLAAAPGAFGLEDDAAVLSIPEGEELVLTKDAIVSGVHFLADDPMDLVAKKLLRVNISDLAAKGAKPLGYLLACCWPKGTPERQLALFAAGLAEDQAAYGISLLGGDTTRGDSALVFSLTALGTVARGKIVRRLGAKLGDKVFVTGTIGDAGLGLKLARGKTLGLGEAEAQALLMRYRLPEPRLAFALAARALMSAAIDVSDGLLADAGHIGEASDVLLRLDLARLPVRAGAQAWLEQGGDPVFLATAGDDYELCFTAPADAGPALAEIAATTGTRLTELGEVVAGKGAVLIGEDGQELHPAEAGYHHF
jgi:thiamine-monophosphate kinase